MAVPHRIRPILPSDAAVWEKLRCELWPDGAAEHAAEIASFFAGTLDEPEAVLVADDADGSVFAFAELAIRRDLDGHRAEPIPLQVEAIRR